MKQFHEFSVDARPWFTWAIGSAMFCFMAGAFLGIYYQSDNSFSLGMLAGMCSMVYFVTKVQRAFKLQQQAYQDYLQTLSFETIKKASTSPELCDNSRQCSMSVLNHKFPGWSFA